jgi:hypothetical protein
MKLNKKKLNVILSQIKAHLNVAVMMDNPEYPGSIDLIFQPKAQGTEFGYLNRLTCGMGGGDDLFADTQIETLGEPVVVNIARLRDALKGGEAEPELKDGVVNGINIQVSSDNLPAISMGRIIKSQWDSMKERIFSPEIKFVMPRIDYELMAGTVSQFITQDPTRPMMAGFNINFDNSEDFINFVATEGRRLAVCKFPFKQSKLEYEKDDGGSFLFKPLCLFIPSSSYSQTQWGVAKDTAWIHIQTEDYSIDCWAGSIDAQFPNYRRVIPDMDQNKEWLSISAKSARTAFESVKGLIINDRYSSVKNQVSFNAVDPKHVKLVIPGAVVDIDGEASRPMCLRVAWDCMDSAFFDTSFTKFMIQNVVKAVLVEDSRAVRGTTMTVTKVIMPIHEDGVDEWGFESSAQIRTGVADSQNDMDDDELDNDITFGKPPKEDKDFDESADQNTGEQGRE